MRLAIRPNKVFAFLKLLALFAMANFTLSFASEKLAFDQSHGAWNLILKENVQVLQGGKVTQFQYAKAKTQSQRIESYIKALSAVSLKEFEAFNRLDQMAFLINAYNAGIVKLVLDRYPIDSIKKIGIPFVGPWKNNFITLFGKEMSPDDLEHGTLRKKYPNPLIHVGVNCASISCPPLRAEAFVGARLMTQLEEQASLFYTHDKDNSYAPDTKVLKLNSILKWFREDFTKTDDKELVRYVAKYQPILAAALAKQGDAAVQKIEYNDYNWQLNDVP